MTKSGPSETWPRKFALDTARSAVRRLLIEEMGLSYADVHAVCDEVKRQCPLK